MILVPTAIVQDTVIEEVERTVIDENKDDLPKSGGPAVGSVLVPTAVLLLGSGVVAYAVLRCR